MAQSNTNKTTALIIIDIQNFYFPEGSVPLFEPEKAAENAKKLLTFFRDQNMTVIHVRHNTNSGAEIHNLVSPKENEKVISKDKANAFVGTDLLEYLNYNKITNLILCGMQTHMCLEAATRAASDFGFNCTVIEDACATRDLKYGDTTVKAKDVHFSTLSTLNGTYAKILTRQEYFELEK
ncbi:MAG: isochorismatase family protein [Bacteroidales bacterium]|nr:isochorismatase family protein [Bacteroidales bacterium]